MWSSGVVVRAVRRARPRLRLVKGGERVPTPKGSTPGVGRVWEVAGEGAHRRPAAVAAASRAAVWQRFGWGWRGTTSCPRESWLGLCAANGRSWLGEGAFPGCCPWRTRARGGREHGHRFIAGVAPLLSPRRVKTGVNTQYGHPPW
jgi:hypothetical protein